MSNLRTNRANCVLTILLALFCFAEVSFAQLLDRPVFTRVVEKMTGKGGANQGYVYGQDSAIWLPYAGKHRVFFGDTIFGPTVDGFHSNSMAETSDTDASNGIDLVYYSPTYSLTVLHPVAPEFTVWLTNAFVIGSDIYSHYLSIPQNWPTVPAIKYGLAKMTGGVPPFVRTSFEALPSDPLYVTSMGTAFVKDGYLYLFGSYGGLAGAANLKRVLLSQVTNRSAYQFWTSSGWTSSATGLVILFSNSMPPTVRFNAFLGKYVATYSTTGTGPCVNCQIAYRTADFITGPWSRENIIFSKPPVRDWGSVYSVALLPEKFNKDSGRVFYTTATTRGDYNVFLHESSFDYARANGAVKTGVDDGYANVGNPPSQVKAQLTTAKIQLLNKGRTIAGYHINTSAFYPISETSSASITLPLYKPTTEVINVSFKIQIGIPNEPAFVNTQGDFQNRTKIATTTYNVTVRPTDTQIVLRDVLRALIDKAQNHAAWVPGQQNNLTVFISRTDAYSSNLYLGTFEGGKPARFDACYGACL